jgi:ribose 5-phosphate isomerase A
MSDRFASAILRWPAQITNLDAKLQVAAKVAAMVQDGQTIGMGSGSAAFLSLQAIGERVAREGLKILVTTTSYETETAATTLGLPLVPLGRVMPDWGVDGADEMDPDRRLIKGRGGALFREKILWATTRRMYLAIDASKHVQRLGERFPVPIEVHPTAVDLLARFLGDTPHELRLAGGKDGPVVTEQGNLIVDARFAAIPHGFHARLKELPGVIETGLFEGYDFEVLEP